MFRKLIRIRSRNQITLPQELTFLWKVGAGDYLRAQISDDGKVSLAPARLAVEGSPEAIEQNRQAEEDIKARRYRTFEDVDSFVRSLEEEKQPAVKAKRSSKATVEAFERAFILATLQSSNWNKHAATKRFKKRLGQMFVQRDLEKVK